MKTWTLTRTMFSLKWLSFYLGVVYVLTLFSMLFEVNVLKMALNVSWVVGKRDPKMSRIWMSERTK